MQNSQENTCVRLLLFKKETPAEVFSCKFGEIFNNNFFIEHLQTTASGFFLVLDITFKNIHSGPEVFLEKSILQNFTRFKEKYLNEVLLVNRLAGLGPKFCFKKEIIEGAFL